jgi:hypothetical protein
MAWWEDPEGSSRGGPLREVARIAAVVTAALAGGAGLLFLITQVLAPAPPRATVPTRSPAVAAVTPAPSPSLAPLPTLPVVPPAPPPTAADGALPDQYLGDLTTDGSTNPGEIAGLDYRFSHGFGMFLGRTTQERFVVPARYQSLSATLKGLGGTIRFTLSVAGQPVLDRTFSPYQPPLTVTCATPEGSTVVLAGVFQGGGSLSDAVAVWGDARFSPAPAPAAGCSS